jgi:hypothetical protein
MKSILGAALAALVLVSFNAPADDDYGDRYGYWKPKTGTVPVRLIHAIDGRDLSLDQALPVDIRIGRKCVARGVTFRTVADGFSLNPGLYTVRISLAKPNRPCRGTLVITDKVNVNFGDNLSLVAHETDDGGIRLTKFIDDIRAAEDGDGRATVRHAADAPAVDILVEGTVAIEGLKNAESEKRDLLAGTYLVQIAPTGGEPLNDGVNLPVPAGKNTIVYAIGSLATGSFDLLTDEIPLQ